MARDPELMRRFLDEHRAICDAIGAGDARGAGRLVEAHIEGARAGLEGATLAGATAGLDTGGRAEGRWRGREGGRVNRRTHHPA